MSKFLGLQPESLAPKGRHNCWFVKSVPAAWAWLPNWEQYSQPVHCWEGQVERGRGPAGALLAVSLWMDSVTQRKLHSSVILGGHTFDNPCATLRLPAQVPHLDLLQLGECSSLAA